MELQQTHTTNKNVERLEAAERMELMPPTENSENGNPGASTMDEVRYQDGNAMLKKLRRFSIRDFVL